MVNMNGPLTTDTYKDIEVVILEYLFFGFHIISRPVGLHWSIQDTPGLSLEQKKQNKKKLKT